MVFDSIIRSTKFQTRNVYFLNRFLNGCNKLCVLAKHQGKKYAQESLTMVIILFRTLFRPTVKKNIMVEKNLAEGRELSKIFINLEQFNKTILKQNSTFLTCYSGGFSENAN